MKTLWPFLFPRVGTCLTLRQSEHLYIDPIRLWTGVILALVFNGEFNKP